VSPQAFAPFPRLIPVERRSSIERCSNSEFHRDEFHQMDKCRLRCRRLSSLRCLGASLFVPESRAQLYTACLSSLRPGDFA
jgi:hypothetical protein